MKKKVLICALVLLIGMSAAIPALAANVFSFTEKSITLFEGETVETARRQEGVYDGDGEISYSIAKPNVATVDDYGTVTALKKGETTLYASLIRNGKRVGRAQATIRVLRAVTKVTLSTANLSVYNPDDPAVTGLLREATDFQVLVIPAGTSLTLSTVCTPEDASSKAVTYTTSDAGVMSIANTKQIRANQRGECDLTITSVQNPEITETYHVLVIQPVKQITIDAGSKKVPKGSVLQLNAYCQPDNASITGVTWSSRNPDIATVNENGQVRGIKRGTVNITATAADGSGTTATVLLNVTEPVTALSVSTPEIQVVVGKTAMAKVSVLPTDATDKTLEWATSDDSIATVRGNGQVIGVKAGTCLLMCTSVSNPEVSVYATVVVSQLVTKIENSNLASELTLKVGEQVQTRWNVLPADATLKDLSFKSQTPKVATVNESGLVTAQKRGVVTITATSKDSSRKQGTVKVTVIQPVTGVTMPKPLYYVQHGRGSTIRAQVLPKDANNQKVYWSSENENVVTIRSNGTSSGYAYGVSNDTTTIYAYTEDGGYMATARVRVGYFNEAVMIEELDVNSKNAIKISLRNMSNELTLANIYYKIECYDMAGNPMICNKDGESTSFTGEYPHLLGPYERTAHGSFRFKNYVIDQPLGRVVLTVTGWRDADGVTWTIPEGDRVTRTWQRYNLNYQGQGVG